MKMFKEILIFVLIGFIKSSLSKTIVESKEEVKNNLRIIDGEEVPAHSMPYMVAIRTSIDEIDILCGGSLLTDSIVLTSAKCLYGATEAEIILGAHDIYNAEEDGQQSITATQLIIHEEFNPETFEHDIALIMLPKAVTLGDNIATIKLPDVTDVFNTYDEEEATVAGWGKTTDTTTETSSVLRAQNLTIIPVIICELPYLFNIKGSQICTSGVSKKNICRGDSGSPLVIDGVQIGIASYGSIYGCAIGFPGVFTRITSYLNWLLASVS